MKKTNFSLINCQLLINVLNGFRAIPAVAKSQDETVTGITADNVYTRADKETLYDWEKYCEGTDSESRVKFMPKELKELGIIGQAPDKTYTVSREKLEEFECEVLFELISRYLVIESGLNADGSISEEDFSAWCENSGDQFFLSLRDLEKSCMLYAETYGIDDLMS